MQSTSAKQFYHLKKDGKLLTPGASYERSSQWVVLEQPTSQTEESLLGCVSSVLDGNDTAGWVEENGTAEVDQDTIDGPG